MAATLTLDQRVRGSSPWRRTVHAGQVHCRWRVIPSWKINVDGNSMETHSGRGVRSPVHRSHSGIVERSKSPATRASGPRPPALAEHPDGARPQGVADRKHSRSRPTCPSRMSFTVTTRVATAHLQDGVSSTRQPGLTQPRRHLPTQPPPLGGPRRSLSSHRELLNEARKLGADEDVAEHAQRAARVLGAKGTPACSARLLAHERLRARARRPTTARAEGQG